MQTPLIGLPNSDVYTTHPAPAAIPPVRFLGRLLRHHPTVFWSGVWVVTLLCSGIAVTGLMNPELSSPPEQPDPTGVGAVLRTTGLDQRRPASPGVSFGLLAVSCAGCCLLLSRWFQQPQSMQRSRRPRSPAAKPIASKLQAIATIAADSTPDPQTSTPLPDRPSWIDAVLSSTHARVNSDPFASAESSQPQASQSLDYLDYLRMYSQSKARSPRSRQGAERSPLRQPGDAPGSDRPPANPPSEVASPPSPSIAPYTPNPSLPI
ncbi:MAG: hypothetical protein D6742_16790, partial [Cyanobacteria bacterium J069]